MKEPYKKGKQRIRLASSLAGEIARCCLKRRQGYRRVRWRFSTPDIFSLVDLPSLLDHITQVCEWRSGRLGLQVLTVSSQQYCCGGLSLFHSNTELPQLSPL